MSISLLPTLHTLPRIKNFNRSPSQSPICSQFNSEKNSTYPLSRDKKKKRRIKNPFAIRNRLESIHMPTGSRHCNFRFGIFGSILSQPLFSAPGVLRRKSPSEFCPPFRIYPRAITRRRQTHACPT